MSKPIGPIRYRNKLLSCSARGCTTTRHSISKWCSRHYRLNAFYGSPTGRKLDRKKDYSVEFQLCNDFITRHIDHVGVAQALSLLTAWLESSVSPGSKLSEAEQVRRLYNNGVTALDILIESSALYLHAKWNPRHVPTDMALTKCLGTAVLYLAPRPKRWTWNNGNPRDRYIEHSPVSRLAVGTFLQQSIGLLYVNLAAAIEAEQEAAKAHTANFLKPFAHVSSVNPTI